MKTKSLSLMTSDEKKSFLSNDLIERMIRVEQAVSAHFGKAVHYTKTEYYKSLSENEKKDYDSYLKNKRLKKILLIPLVALIVIPLIFLGRGMTGNVIKTGFLPGEFVYSSIIFVPLWVIIFMIVYLFFKRTKNRKMESHTRVINHWIGGKLKNKKR